MRLNEIRIDKLFGHFDHVVKLNHEEKITIITAPNGYGKTMILKTINFIFNNKISSVKNVDFKKIVLIFSDTFISIEKDDENTLTIKLKDGYPSGKLNNKTLDEFKYNCLTNTRDISISSLNAIDDLVPHLERLSRREWVDHAYHEIISFDEVLDRYPETNDIVNIDNKEIPEWFIKITEGINVHFVQDQRLILRSEIDHNEFFHNRRPSRKKFRTIDTIEKYSFELSKFISMCNESYTDMSKKLDGSLPARLLSQTKKIEIYDQETLKIKLDDLKNKNERLKQHQLLNSEHKIFIPEIDGISFEDIKVLSLYVQDNTKKLSVYDDLLSRIELFTNILNNKGLAFKKIIVNPENGFLFENDLGKTLKLTQLSSGEQHEVILVYELIFMAKDNDIVLIDEPEISLHIAWQKEFLEDLKRIIDIQNVSIIIATHSPQIIDNNWDLTIDLGC